jgi:hypothetical protein
MRFKAKYPGTCKICDEHIFINDEIEWSRGKPAVHAECADKLKEEGSVIFRSSLSGKGVYLLVNGAPPEEIPRLEMRKLISYGYIAAGPIVRGDGIYKFEYELCGDVQFEALEPAPAPSNPNPTINTEPVPAPPVEVEHFESVEPEPEIVLIEDSAPAPDPPIEDIPKDVPQPRRRVVHSTTARKFTATITGT